MFKNVNVSIIYIAIAENRVTVFLLCHKGNTEQPWEQSLLVDRVRCNCLIRNQLCHLA